MRKRNELTKENFEYDVKRGLDVELIAEKYKLTIPHVHVLKRRYGINLPRRKPKPYKHKIPSFRRKDLSNHSFGKLKVIEYDSTDTYGRCLWKCQCECGNIVVKNGKCLRKGITVKCGNCPKPTLPQQIYCYIRNSAFERKIDFVVTKDYLENIFILQNKKCILSGLELYISHTKKEHYTGLTTASLDRINSYVGYVEGNVQWVHKYVNCMKLNHSQDYFLSLIERIYNYRHKPTNITHKIEITPKEKRWKGLGNIPFSYFNRIKYQAQQRNKQFLITIEDIWRQYIKQCGRCYLSGIELEFGNKSSDYNIITASIDRIDNTKGYTKDNIAICHKHINLMKLDFELSEFLYYVDTVFKHTVQ